VSAELVELKRQAAHRAVEWIESGMVIGLGHGSTAIHAVRRLAELLDTGALQDVVAIPASRQVEEEAEHLGIPLTTLESHPVIDITIDGADEVDPNLNLIKGGGGALLREKIIAQASRREVIVVDDSKLSPALGTTWRVPIEVVPFGWTTQMAFLIDLGAQPALRRAAAGERFHTDQGNVILDCAFGPLDQPAKLAVQLDGRAGIVEHGLFLGMATDVIVAGVDGIRHLTAGAR
jgi:ribose 5-phosphate isomerase A